MLQPVRPIFSSLKYAHPCVSPHSMGHYYWKVVKATEAPGVFRSLHGKPCMCYELGKTYTLETGLQPRLCAYGFHACQDVRVLMTYLKLWGYSPQDVVLKVQLGGMLVSDDAKTAASEITILGVSSWKTALAETIETYGNEWAGTHIYSFDKGGEIVCSTNEYRYLTWSWGARYH